MPSTWICPITLLSQDDPYWYWYAESCDASHSPTVIATLGEVATGCDNPDEGRCIMTEDALRAAPAGNGPTREAAVQYPSKSDHTPAPLLDPTSRPKLQPGVSIASVGDYQVAGMANRVRAYRIEVAADGGPLTFGFGRELDEPAQPSDPTLTIVGRDPSGYRLDLTSADPAARYSVRTNTPVK